MIDVYAAAGTFTDKHQLATDLAVTLMAIEGVPDIPMFRQNTAAFIHELPAGNVSNVDGASSYVRVQVLTNVGALDRDKQIAVVSQFTSMIADAAHDPALADRTWVLLTEAAPGGWGLDGHANTNDELVAAARKQIAELQQRHLWDVDDVITPYPVRGSRRSGAWSRSRPGQRLGQAKAVRAVGEHVHGARNTAGRERRGEAVGVLGRDAGFTRIGR